MSVASSHVSVTLFVDSLNSCSLVAFGAIESTVAVLFCGGDTLLEFCSELDGAISIEPVVDDWAIELGKVPLVTATLLLPAC